VRHDAALLVFIPNQPESVGAVGQQARVATSAANDGARDGLNIGIQAELDSAALFDPKDFRAMAAIGPPGFDPVLARWDP